MSLLALGVHKGVKWRQLFKTYAIQTVFTQNWIVKGKQYLIGRRFEGKVGMLTSLRLSFP